MKVIFVYGSTREGSHSKKVMDAMAAVAAANGREVVKYDISTMPLEGCRGCGACRRGGCDCVRQDGLKDYFADLWQASAVVYSAPIFMGQPAGQAITFMNRHYCMKDSAKNNRLPAGIKVAAVYAQGAPAVYPAYEAGQDWLLNTLGRYGMEVAGKLVAGGDSDLSDDGELLTRARALAETL